MTGGAGFSRTGENAIKQNRELMGGRTLMKDNPYAPSNFIKRIPALKNYTQIKQWRHHRDKTRRRTRWRVVTTASVLIAILIWILMTLI